MRAVVYLASVGLLIAPCDSDAATPKRAKSASTNAHRGLSPQVRALRQSPKKAAARGQFANCSEARAAGAAPIRRGEPGYSPKLDRDGDG